MRPRSDNHQRAIVLLTHYLQQVYKRAGMNWDTDNDAEVVDLCDALVDAAREDDD